jgi:hypothetical protein
VDSRKETRGKEAVLGIEGSRDYIPDLNTDETSCFSSAVRGIATKHDQESFTSRRARLLVLLAMQVDSLKFKMHASPHRGPWCPMGLIG